MSPATTRRRRPQAAGKVPTSDDTKDYVVEPIDETEQAQLVEQLRQQALEQMDLIHNIFSRVCEAAMVLCILLGLTSMTDFFGWAHVLGSVALHWAARSIAANIKTTTISSQQQQHTAGGAVFDKILPVVALLTVVAILPLTLENIGSSSSGSGHDHHLGMALTNIVTMLGALYIKHDSQSTMKQVETLEKSKYNYKSL